MKPVHFTLLTISLVFTSFVADAQMILDLYELYKDFGGINHYVKQQENTDIQGSPYLDKDFKEGIILINDSAMYKGVPLRYDVYSEQMEFKHPNGTVLVIDKPESFKEYIVDGRHFIYQSSTDGTSSGFFEVLEKGPATLAKKHTMSLKEAVPTQAYKDPQPAKFIAKPDSYFVIKENNLFEVKNNKDLLEELSDQKSKLSSFIKKNKLKVRREDDLKEIIAYYNTL